MGQRRGPGGRFLGFVNSLRHRDLTSTVNRIARAKAMKSMRWGLVQFGESSNCKFKSYQLSL